MTDNVHQGTFGRNVLGSRLDIALAGLGGVHPKDQITAVFSYKNSTVELAKMFHRLNDQQYKLMAEVLMDVAEYLIEQIKTQDEVRKLKNFENSAGQI